MMALDAGEALAVVAFDIGPSSLRAEVRQPRLRLRIAAVDLGGRAARCLVDGHRVRVRPMARDAADAVRVVRDIVSARGIDVRAVEYRLIHINAEHVTSERIDDALVAELGKLTASTPGLAAQLAVVEAARAAWPDAMHMAYFGADGEVDDRADRMLADPRTYFARARERARAEIEQETAPAHRTMRNRLT